MTRQILTQLDDDCLAFPPLAHALKEPNGLLAIGGDLTPARILLAYEQGIFPWFSEQDPILWWSPDPRAVIYTDQLRINKTLRKFLKKTNYTVSVNHAFEEVIDLCADAPFRDEDTWILPEMLAGYIELHHKGHAHSIEVWHEQELIGGLYGVAVNGHFSGESMFYKKPNASKVALVALQQLLSSIGGKFIDCQLQNPFMQDLGCVEISRKEFIKLQQAMSKLQVPNNFWQPRFLTLL